LRRLVLWLTEIPTSHASIRACNVQYRSLLTSPTSKHSLLSALSALFPANTHDRALQLRLLKWLYHWLWRVLDAHLVNKDLAIPAADGHERLSLVHLFHLHVRDGVSKVVLNFDLLVLDLIWILLLHLHTPSHSHSSYILSYSRTHGSSETTDDLSSVLTKSLRLSKSCLSSKTSWLVLLLVLLLAEALTLVLLLTKEGHFISKL
jgi:hypothetical protein